tara:strand:+ start:1599 stop:1964 length:366 start_codon:yes stop_codon:yes gene_type:complete
MAYSIPYTWTERMVVAAQLNQYLRDNLAFFSTHTHTGANGDGSDTLAISLTATGQGVQAMPDTESSPSSIGILQRKADTLEYHNGATIVVLTADYGPVGTYGSARTLGTGANQAAAGNHTH